jgi:hypothetical protein
MLLKKPCVAIGLLVCMPILLPMRPALAQAAPVPAARSKAKVKQLTPDEQVAQHIARLHAALKITPAQSQQWDAFAQMMRENATHMEGLYQLRAHSAATMNALDSMKSSEQIAEAHAQDLQKLQPPFEALYNSMSDGQKKTADRLFRRPPA